VEARADLVSAGPTLTARTPFGEIETAVAISRADGTSGFAASAAYAYIGRRMSLGVAARGMTERYSTSSLGTLDDRPRVDANAYVSFQAGSRTSITIQRRDTTAYVAGTGTRTAVTTSTRLSSRTDVFLTASDSHGAGQVGREIFAGVSIRLTSNAIASVSAERTATGNHAVTEIQQPLPVGQGWGYRLHAENGSQSYSSGSVQYQGPYGRYELRNDTINGVSQTVLSASGGIVAIDGGVYPSRPVQDGFALVRVPDVAGVRTYASNQEVGRTDGHGNLLVPNLLSYYGNILNISDQDVPFDHAIDGVRRTIAPPYRGGALVVFPVQPRQGVTGRIALDVDGSLVVPAYGELTVKDSAANSPVGEGGEFYFERLAPGRHEAVVQYKSMSCTFTLDVPSVGAPVINLGSVVCSVTAR
jgi:outer membrane usher protein